MQLKGTIDSTGDQYTSWGLPYPRGRDKIDSGYFNNSEEVFGATGGASLYRLKMLEKIGIFDEDFFAYYEDVDISFRAQLDNWKIEYTPTAIAYHKGGATSKKIPNLAAYMTVKNLPWLLIKNVPLGLLPSMLPRFIIAYSAIVFSALAKGKFLAVGKGIIMMLVLMPKKIIQRHKIQKSKTVSVDYVKSIITYDLPTNAHNLRQVRLIFNRFRFWR